MDKSVRYSCQIFSGFKIPNITKIGYFLTELFKKNKKGTQRYNTVHPSVPAAAAGRFAAERRASRRLSIAEGAETYQLKARSVAASRQRRGLTLPQTERSLRNGLASVRRLSDLSARAVGLLLSAPPAGYIRCIAGSGAIISNGAVG